VVTPAWAHDSDRLVEFLSPDTALVLDGANCIVLVTPGRRVTITNEPVSP
jgi:hypothetical protein